MHEGVQNNSWISRQNASQWINKNGGKAQWFWADWANKTKKISKKNISLLNPTASKSKKYSTQSENKWIFNGDSVKTFDNRGEQSTSPHLIRIDGNWP